MKGLIRAIESTRTGDPRWITAKNPLNANSAALLSFWMSADKSYPLKFREDVGSNSDYRDLLDTLQHEAGVHYSKVDGDLQGRGYIVGLEKVKLLLVEHETGLEVLYIAGSIASCVRIDPSDPAGWAAIQDDSQGDTRNSVDPWKFAGSITRVIFRRNIFTPDSFLHHFSISAPLPKRFRWLAPSLRTR